MPEPVRQAIARPVLSHRGAEFTAILRRAEELLQPVMGTSNRVLFFASSGTGMMEASLANILAPGERILVTAHGAFGDRFADIARALGAAVDTLEIPWGCNVDPAEIRRRLSAADYRAVVVVHNESSTGVVAPLAAIGAVLRDSPALLVVDSVSGLGGIEMRQDEWGIDVLVSASQKCLMCPPGLGVASLSPKAWNIIQRPDRLPRYYWDFRKALASAEKSETPFTTPVALVAGLREALEIIHAEGLPTVFARHRRLSSMLQEGAAALGLTPFPQTALSPTVVCMNVPAHLSGKEIVRTMYQRHATVIAGSRNKLAGKVIRIGTMGSVSETDIVADLHYLKETLQFLEENRS